MANYKLIIQYDGTRYRGWQVQNSTEDTIQGILERTISRLLNDFFPEQAPNNIEVIGSGRTDAGVHALGQVANFHYSTPIDNLNLFLDELNHYLPEDIAVTSIEAVEERFHARFNARLKTYDYRINTSRRSRVFDRKYIYTYIDKPLDINRMKLASKELLGTHDYKSFCGNKSIKKSTIRTIESISIDYSDDLITVSYTGNGFLQNMVRILTGTLIEVGAGLIEPEDIPAILSACNRERAGFTAPPCGLRLVEVKY